MNQAAKLNEIFFAEKNSCVGFKILKNNYHVWQGVAKKIFFVGFMGPYSLQLYLQLILLKILRRLIFIFLNDSLSHKIFTWFFFCKEQLIFSYIKNLGDEILRFAFPHSSTDS